MIIRWVVACVVDWWYSHHVITTGFQNLFLVDMFETIVILWLICLKYLFNFGWYDCNIYFTLVDMLEIFNILWLVCLKCLLNYYMFKTCHSVEMKYQIEFFFCDKNILWFRNISIFLIPHSLIRFCLSSQVGDRRMKSGNNSKFNWDKSFQWQWKFLILIFFKNLLNILFDIL